MSFKNTNIKNVLASIYETQGKSGRYFRFGNQDNFPNLLTEYVNNSGTAISCVKRLNQFLFGQGFVSDTLMTTKANPKETWKQLTKQMVAQVNYFNGFAIQVKFDQAGRPARYYIMTLQHIRKRSDGLFLYNETLGDPQGYLMYRTALDVVIPPFREAKTPQEQAQLAAQRRELVQQQIKDYGEQYGELLYVYEKGIGLNYEVYPVPAYASGLNDLSADGALSVHEDNSVSNSFKAGVVITTHKMDRATKDEDDSTEYERFVDSMEEFTGADGSAIAHIEVDWQNTDQQPSITPLNIQHQMDATEKATERIAKKVCRLFGVPPVLIGIDTAGKLGDNQELVNKLKLFNLTLEDSRELIYSAFESLFPELPQESYELVPLDLFDYIPNDVIKLMTPDQINEVYNLPTPQNTDPATGQPMEEAATQEQPEINETFTNLTGRQEQGIDRIVRKFKRGQLSEAAAKMRLRSGYGMTEDQANIYLDIDDGSIID